MTPAEYRAKAEQLLKEAQEAEPKGSPEKIALALGYLKLADLAEQNARNDVVYETPVRPAGTVLMQQQPQAQQQQAQQQQAQQAAKDEPADEKK
jgi:hypothetical protein